MICSIPDCNDVVVCNIHMFCQKHHDIYLDAIDNKDVCQHCPTCTCDPDHDELCEGSMCYCASRRKNIEVKEDES